MIKPRFIAGQVAAFAAFAAVVGYFSHAPAYVQHPPGVALIKLSMTHPGKRVDECHQRTPEELAKLAPNMRAKQSCGRERNEVTIELDIDGRNVVHKTAAPTGLSRDGTSRFYDSFEIPAGPHGLVVRMRDSGRKDGFDHVAERQLTLAPRQVLVIDFDEEDGHLVFE